MNEKNVNVENKEVSQADSIKGCLLIIIAVIGVFFFFKSCVGCSSGGYEGTYVADITIMQSGKLTTYIIKEDGSAIVISPDGYEEHKYWDEYEDNVIQVHDKHAQYDEFLDFDSKMLYLGGYSSYRSKEHGYPFREK